MRSKLIHIISIIAVFSLFFLLPLKADAANYKLVRSGTKMQCIDLTTDQPVTLKFIRYKGYNYYFGEDSYAHTGWLKYGKDHYFFNANGAMQKNTWIGKYYLQSNGKMAVSKFITPSQYVGKDGALVPGYTKKTKAKFIKKSAGTKYRNYDGTYSAKTWQCIKGKWYYFYSSGYMAKNRRIGEYFVNKKGQMVTNKRVKIQKYYYYYGPDGCLTKRQKVK